MILDTRDIRYIIENITHMHALYDLSQRSGHVPSVSLNQQSHNDRRFMIFSLIE